MFVGCRIGCIEYPCFRVQPEGVRDVSLQGGSCINAWSCCASYEGDAIVDGIGAVH